MHKFLIFLLLESWNAWKDNVGANNINIKKRNTHLAAWIRLVAILHKNIDDTTRILDYSEVWWQHINIL